MLLTRHLMKPEWIRRLHEMAVEHDTWFWAYSVEGVYNRNNWVQEELETLMNVEKHSGEEIEYIIVRCDDGSKIMVRCLNTTNYFMVYEMTEKRVVSRH
ncbi:hypothetical protein GCM10020370_40480 [Paenibacillus hodogayensis]